MKNQSQKVTAKPCKSCRCEPIIITKKLTGRQQKVSMVVCSNPKCTAYPATGWHEDKDAAVAEWNEKYATRLRE